LSRDEFYARLSGVKLPDLLSMAQAEGLNIVASKRSDAVDELWAAYSGKRPAPAAEPAAVEAPPAPVALEYEGRICAPERSRFIRAGYHFSRAWQTLSPMPSAEQLAALRAEPVVQIRIKG
jgi:hypothetical protein